MLSALIAGVLQTRLKIAGPDVSIRKFL